MATVHVRVSDSTTGQPGPVRIRFLGPDRTYHAPLGRLTDFATAPGEDVGGNLLLDGTKWAYIDGTCEINLPPGNIRIEALRGPEYLPLRQEVNLKQGQLSLRLEIQRWCDMRALGWFAGETRAQFLSPHAALLEGAAEDLAVVNVLAAYRPHPPASPNLLDFSGQEPAIAKSGHLVVVNTLNTGGALGDLALLNCHRVVYPLMLGEAEEVNWTLADWCDQCHRKNGLVVWPGFDPVLAPGELPGERLADLLLGKIDVVETTALSWCKEGHEDWYGVLNCGLRVPLVGSSGKRSNAECLGRVRTYAHLNAGADLTYKNWIEAVRAGRTFVTDGPVMSLSVNDAAPGSVLALPAGTAAVRVRAEARSWFPFEQLEVLCNGAVVASTKASGQPRTATLAGDVALPASGWLAARCWGQQSAHTSPVYARVEGRPPSISVETRRRFDSRLERMLTWIDREARFDTERRRQNLTDVFLGARQQLFRDPSP